MAQEHQKSSKETTTEEEDYTVEAQADSEPLHDLVTDTDDLLDEIDDVLEENAEDFVRAYVQKGGE